MLTLSFILSLKPIALTASCIIEFTTSFKPNICRPKAQRELDRVQSVVNTAARLSADARKYDHVTPLLMDLHWLRVPERVKFKLCMLMHRCLTGAAPRYLTELAVPVASTARRRLTVFLQPVELVTTCTLTMLGALEVVRAAYCAL